MSAEQTPRLKPSKRPRYRYILFTIDGVAPERNDLIRTIQAAAGPEAGAWLTRYEAGRGILRVLRGHEDAGRRMLESLTTYRVKPVSTSGTIAALERRHRHHGRRQLG